MPVGVFVGRTYTDMSVPIDYFAKDIPCLDFTTVFAGRLSVEKAHLSARIIKLREETYRPVA